MKKTKGFTLVEMLVVVAAIAIMAAVAIPSYNDYTTRGKIAEATSTLSDGRIKMEQFFQDNRTYISGPAPAATTYFNYAVSGASLTAYTITATGKAGLSTYAYSIDQGNNKNTTAIPAAWLPAGVTLPATCWIVKKKAC
jgi:type IV pilus assembly protein PilE